MLYIRPQVSWPRRHVQPPLEFQHSHVQFEQLSMILCSTVTAKDVHAFRILLLSAVRVCNEQHLASQVAPRTYYFLIETKCFLEAQVDGLLRSVAQAQKPIASQREPLNQANTTCEQNLTCLDKWTYCHMNRYSTTACLPSGCQA